MANPFFEHPILNSPYDCPQRHWELDKQGQPTQQILEKRRRAEFITPIPKPKKRRGASAAQENIVFDEGKGISTAKQQYDPTSVINEIRSHVDQWRDLAPSLWQVTPETARLLQHWRHHKFSSVRPFFCQVEAVETAIWLNEVAPHTAAGKRVLELLSAANREANPELNRLALKLATGAGKTTVMAMIIAWQTINAVRRPNSKNFSRGFLVVAPGLTIKDRLRVLQPHDPDSYYGHRELVPQEMLEDLQRAKIVITNFHSFKLRERIELSSGGRALLQGRGGEDLNTLETEGQMIQRVMPDLMGLKNIVVLNDEAHHCYRVKPPEPDDDDLKGEDKRVVIHKTSRYWPEEMKGFKAALGEVYHYDFLALETSDVRFMRIGRRPPLRGTVVTLGEGNYLLFGNGYVPYLRAYPGKRIPRPLEIVEHHGVSPAETVCQEVLALTKLNWNSCTFASSIPITIRFARDVGKILTELPKGTRPETKYKFYM